jgi:hypothetical protein
VTLRCCKSFVLFFKLISADYLTPHRKISPLEFGFRLSDTTFNYSGLSIQAINKAGNDPADAASVLAWENGDAIPIAEGSSRAFWYVLFDFDDSDSLRNTPMIRLHRSAFTIVYSLKILVRCSVEM